MASPSDELSGRVQNDKALKSRQYHWILNQQIFARTHDEERIAHADLIRDTYQENIAECWPERCVILQNQPETPSQLNTVLQQNLPKRMQTCKTLNKRTAPTGSQTVQEIGGKCETDSDAIAAHAIPKKGSNIKGRLSFSSTQSVPSRNKKNAPTCYFYNKSKYKL